MASHVEIRVRNVQIVDVLEEHQQEHSQVIGISLKDVRSGSHSVPHSLQFPSLQQRAWGRQISYSSACSVLPERGRMQLLGKLTETSGLQIDVQKSISLDDPCQSYRLAETQCVTSPLREPAPEPPTLSATVRIPSPDVEEGVSDAETKELMDMKRDLHHLEDILVDIKDDIIKPSDNNTRQYRAVLEHLKGLAKKLHDIRTPQSRGFSPNVEVLQEFVESRSCCRLHLQHAWPPLAESQPLPDHHTLSMPEFLETPKRTLSPSGPYTDAAVKTVPARYLTQVSRVPEDKRSDQWHKVAQTSGATWDPHNVMEPSHANQVAPVTVFEVLENKKAYSSIFTPQVMPLCFPSLPRSQFRCASPALLSHQVSHRHLRKSLGLANHFSARTPGY